MDVLTQTALKSLVAECKKFIVVDEFIDADTRTKNKVSVR